MLTTALQFSGGKDSLAILHLYREQLPDILVCWVNSGAAYPEVEAQMREIAQQVPHFLEVQGLQPAVIESHGYPVDVLPIVDSPMGHLFVGGERAKLQNAFDCCGFSLAAPMALKMKELGITRIIRGQRASELYRNSTIHNGSVINGVEYILPLERWSTQEVQDYLNVHGIAVPAYYESELTSRDCWNCTAHLSQNVQRIRNLPHTQRAEVQRRLAYIDRATQSALQPLRQLIEAA